MATRSPTAFHGYWGNTYVTPADLPNVAASPTQSATLGADVAGVSDTFSLVVTNTSGGNANYQAAIDWLALT